MHLSDAEILEGFLQAEVSEDMDTTAKELAEDSQRRHGPTVGAAIAIM